MEHITLPEFRTLWLPFSQAVCAGDFLFLSGAIGTGPGTLTLVDRGLAGRPAKPWRISGKSSGRAGLGFSDTVRWTIMLADMRR